MHRTGRRLGAIRARANVEDHGRIDQPERGLGADQAGDAPRLAGDELGAVACCSAGDVVSSLVMSPARPRSSSSAVRTCGSNSSADGGRVKAKAPNFGASGSFARAAQQGAARRVRAVHMRSASARVRKVRTPALSVSGKSLRQWPPRDFMRCASAAAVTSLAAAVMFSSAGSWLVVSSRGDDLQCAWRAGHPPSRSSASVAAHRGTQHMRRRRRGEALRRRGKAAHCARAKLAAHVVSHPRPKHQTFQQGVGGQAIGAVKSGGGAFAHHPQAGQRGAAGGIRSDASHVVVRGRRDRNGLARRIDAGRHAGLIDGGEMAGEFRADRRAAIQEGACWPETIWR